LEELENLWATGKIETYSKKMKSTLQREMAKIKSNLEGLRKMDKIPGAMVIVDTRREHIAVKEAKKLGVTTIALIDTDSDPDLIDLPIPGNDDAMRAIEIILHEIADGVIDGKQGRVDKPEGEQAPQPRRRSSRSQFRADERTAEAASSPEPAAEPAPEAVAAH
jgi:small subunit ribosomal protein S2